MIWLALVFLVLGIIEMRREPGTGIGLICLVVAVVLSLAACGDDDPNQDRGDITKINSCIARGGHPITSSDQYGTVFYVACDTNTGPSLP